MKLAIPVPSGFHWVCQLGKTIVKWHKKQQNQQWFSGKKPLETSLQSQRQSKCNGDNHSFCDQCPWQTCSGDNGKWLQFGMCCNIFEFHCTQRSNKSVHIFFWQQRCPAQGRLWDKCITFSLTTRRYLHSSSTAYNTLFLP